MVRIILLLIPLLLVAFWLWMFSDMMNNAGIPSAAPQGFRWPPEAKNQWIVLFVILNIFTAIYYYVTEYRNKRRA